MTNPVPCLCPCCRDQQKTFLQSIHSDGIFKVLSKYGDFKRDYLFCHSCIEVAKNEILKMRELNPQKPQKPQYSPISEVSDNRSTPGPFHEANVDPIPADPMPADPMPADPMPADPFNEIIGPTFGQQPVTVISQPMMIGQRLAGLSASPLHLGSQPLMEIEAEMDKEVEMDKPNGKEVEKSLLDNTQVRPMQNILNSDLWPMDDDNLKRKMNKKFP